MAPTRRRAALAAGGRPFGSPSVPLQPAADLSSPLRQKLMWGDADSPKVDIVEATRLSFMHVSLPPNSDLSYVDSGIRFDPKEFPDLARKTQEKLATRIIESGSTREHGRTIKVKEYSSRQRKRIRFACSRDECNVTFQINFDSNKGHWFMKRNKGNFEHSCSALRSAVQAAQRRLLHSQQQQKQPTPLCVPVAPQTPPLKPEKPASTNTTTPTESPTAPHLAKSRTQSLKRCSPEPSPAEIFTPKKSKTQTLPPSRPTSGKPMAPKVSLASHEATPGAERSTESLSSSEGKDKLISTVPQSITVDESKKQTPKTRNGERKSWPTQPMHYPPIDATFDEHLSLPPFLPTKEEFAQSTKALLRPSRSTVAVSVYSQNILLNEEEKNSKGVYPPTNARTGGFFEDTMFASTPPSPPKAKSPQSHFDFAEEMLTTFSPQDVLSFEQAPPEEKLIDPYNSKPEALALMDTDAEASNLPSLMAASSSSHASLLEAGDIEDFPVVGEAFLSSSEPCLGPFLYTLENAPQTSSNYVSGSGTAIDAPAERVLGVGQQQGAEVAEERGPQHVETLSHKLSLCSLMVSPLDMVELGDLAKQVGANNDIDDNSSISTNWSVSDFQE